MPLGLEDHNLVLLVLPLLHALHELIAVIGLPATKEPSESLLPTDPGCLLGRHLLLPGPILLSRHLLVTVARLMTDTRT